MKVTKVLTDIDRPCAFVPTMGALHAGHQSLISRARELCDEVVVSVFVNPLQFEDKDDLAKYPHTPELDEELAREAGATILWRPEYNAIYPDSIVKLSAGELGRKFEGVHRPGHFDGVLTVVNRLFELVQPRYAIFGEKDFQQLFLIKTIAAGVEIVTAPTFREPDGMAASSRNARLTQEGRQAAAVIFSALKGAGSEDQLRQMLATEPLFQLDYADFIDEVDFTHAHSGTQNVRAIVAGWINGVRLIDNMRMELRA